jgi:nanoRNase/pAp phosphatase (c-di-AMP/oligoRNAs hydrolase)
MLNGANVISFGFDNPTTGDGVYVVPVVNASCNVSEVCNALLEKHPESKFAAAYADMSDGRRSWSLRSRKDFDSSEIAKRFGGGGHPQSSGFTTFHDADYGVAAKSQNEGTAK